MGAFSSIPKDLSNAQCQIALREQTVTAGTMCVGYIQLNITAPIKCEQILIDLKGEAYTTVGYSSGSGKRRRRRTARENSVLYTLRMIAAQYPNGTAPPGQYQIPFQFEVPKNAPASFILPTTGRNSARITHSVAVSVQVKGKVYYVQACPFQVLSPLNHAVNAMMIEDVRQVSFCCCFAKGNVSLAARTDKNAYASNEIANIIYEVSNNSSQKITSVNVELVRAMTYRARGHGSWSNAKVVQLRCGSIEANSGFGSKASPPSPALQVQMQIPMVEFSTCETPTISTRYVLRLQAMTGSCISNPKVEIPVTLYQTASANQGQMMVQAIVQSYQSTPDADASGGMQIPIASAIPYNPNVNLQNQFQPTNKSLMKPIPVDTTGDGIANAMGYDTTGDGMIDSLDTTGDGKIDSTVAPTGTNIHGVGLQKS